jgi:hypothetical protein
MHPISDHIRIRIVFNALTVTFFYSCILWQTMSHVDTSPITRLNPAPHPPRMACPSKMGPPTSDRQSPPSFKTPTTELGVRAEPRLSNRMERSCIASPCPRHPTCCRPHIGRMYETVWRRRQRRQCGHGCGRALVLTCQPPPAQLK